MELYRALSVLLPGEVVALVGGGGKTSAMYRLARELAAAGYRGVVTTTTKVWAPTPDQVPELVVAERWPLALTGLGPALARSPLVALGASRGPEGKLYGVDPDWVGALRTALGVDFVLVEADGAAGRPLKGPASHEPVIPASTTLLVPVAGASALGRPLGSDIAHRPEIVARLTGLGLGEAVTPEAVARLLLHPEGNVKGAPASARVVPLINQVDSPEIGTLARDLAAHLLKQGLGRAVLARLAAEPPEIEVVAAFVSSLGGMPWYRQ
ncbi:MAG: putative selenium-dependent hydroxylase accessory protein YqeC [Chloroflexi bacterium]|nr:putative selenium-dependent hydroxylase accessory protein YqeC [Chloroflexota bacterium]